MAVDKRLTGESPSVDDQFVLENIIDVPVRLAKKSSDESAPII